MDREKIKQQMTILRDKQKNLKRVSHIVPVAPTVKNKIVQLPTPTPKTVEKTQYIPPRKVNMGCSSCARKMGNKQ